MQLNALSPEQHAELESLQSVFMNEPDVQEYFEAQTELTTSQLCHLIATVFRRLDDF
jgi:hypothetical protein